MTDFPGRVRGLLDDLDAASGEAIGEAAALLLDSVEAGGIVHVAGAGHSLALVCETFYRAGGLAAARPATTLADHARIVLDTRVPPGDVLHPAGAPRTAAVSTVLGAYAWARVLAALDDLAAERGADPARWTSANVPGGDAVNAALLERYRHRVPELTDE